MPAVLGANQYLGIDSLDTDLLFMVVVALGGVVVGLALFRGVGRLRESSNLRKSSWKTFEKVAKVRGLTSLEVSTLRSVVRASKIERPSQVLGSILLFDKCVDRALDKEALSSVEQGLLDGIRERLATATVVWDRRSDRRDFERADCDLDIHIRLVSRDSMDEELKSSYQEGDAKFNEAFEELLAEVPSGAAHVQNLCAGGVSLLLSHEDAAGAKVGDYVSLESGDTPVPFNLDSLSARVTGTQELKDEGKINLNLSFLPYERELRRQIIGVVYEAAEAAPKKSEPDIAQGTEMQDAKAAAKTPPQTMPTQKGVARKSAAKKKSRKTPAEEAKKGKTSVRPRRNKRRRPDAASKTDRNE